MLLSSNFFIFALDCVLSCVIVSHNFYIIITPVGTVAANNLNGNGPVYYNGAGGELVGLSNTLFTAAAGVINFTGEIADRSNNFTAGWYVDNLRGIGNGLVADLINLNGFLDGDNNQSGLVDAADINSCRCSPQWCGDQYAV